jgi:hypothetical protein
MHVRMYPKHKVDSTASKRTEEVISIAQIDMLYSHNAMQKRPSPETPLMGTDLVLPA